MIARHRLLTLAAAAFLLASCGPPAMTPNFADIHFTSGPLALQASQIIIRNQSATAGDPGYPVQPVHAMENWANDRLRPNGQGGPARFTINASAAVKNIPANTSGISGAVTDQISQQYDVTVDGTLELLDDHQMAIRSVRATAARAMTVLQSSTINDRDQARYDLVKATMTDFDRQIEEQMRNNFGTYLLSR